MKRIVEIDGKNESVLKVVRIEYLPVASIQMENLEVDATDDLDVFRTALNLLDNGGDMRQVTIGDDINSIAFDREDGSDSINITVTHGSGTKFTDIYDVEELAVALRFITMNDESSEN